MRILASINHPNIISYKEAFIEKGSNALLYFAHYAVLLWSMQMGEIYFRKLNSAVKHKAILHKEKFGAFLYKLLKGSRHFMTLKYYTEILKVQMYFYFKMEWWSWETWMCLNLLGRHVRLKPVRPIMQARKYGSNNLMIKNQIFGH